MNKQILSVKPINLWWRKIQTLQIWKTLIQKATDADGTNRYGVISAEQIKEELSYNNINDTDATTFGVEFDLTESCRSMDKHANPYRCY